MTRHKLDAMRQPMDIEIEHESDERMTVSVGPHHPSTHGVLRLILELEGERIVTAEPEQGFLHTGIEKSAENLTWQQAITVIDRADYLSPLGNNLVYVLGAEKLLGLEIPAKATYLRTLFTELQRIASHLVWLGTTGLDIGAQSVFFWCFEWREGILDLFEEASGARMNPSYFRIGGIARDLPAGFEEQCRAWLEAFPARLRELHDLLDTNPIWVDRTRRIGALTAEQALALGMTGPLLRASGVAYDVRRAFPYLIYDQLNFEVPLGKNGDCYDRYWVRMRELDESWKICCQVLDGIPDGSHVAADRKIVLPPRHELKTSMESLIHHFKLVSYGFDVPAGEVYQAIESPRGELGMYIVSDGGNKPWRVRYRPPSFYTVHALPAMMQNGLIADMVAVIAAADPVFGEVDR